jgi:hypothetical protein
MGVISKNSRFSSIGETSSINNKALIEQKIAQKNAKENETPLVTLLGSPAQISDYLYQNETLSTHREGFNDNIRDIGNGITYDRYRNLPLYGLPDNLIESNTKDPDRGIYMQLKEMQWIVLPNTITPNVGDRLVLHAYGPNVVFKVTETIPAQFKEKPFYIITCNKDNELSNINQISKSINKTYYTLVENVGVPGKKVFIEADKMDGINTLKNIKENLMVTYLDSFYDKDLNMLVYGTTSHGLRNIISFNSLISFQDTFEILKYKGVSTLFTYNPMPIMINKDFNLSLYKSLLKGKYKEISHCEEKDYLNQNIFLENEFLRAATIRTIEDNKEWKLSSDEYPVLNNNEKFTDFWFKIFYGPYAIFSPLSPLRGFNGGMYVFRSTSIDFITRCFEYHLTNDIIRLVLHEFISDGKLSSKTLELLEDFNISEDNLDHYIFIPLILQILEMGIYSYEADSAAIFDDDTTGGITWIK